MNIEFFFFVFVYIETYVLKHIPEPSVETFIRRVLKSRLSQCQLTGDVTEDGERDYGLCRHR